VSKSEIEKLFAWQIRASRLPAPMREHRFHPTRRWRFDFAWPEPKIAAEIEGGTWNRGRHTRGSGFEQDCEKHAEAALLGWTVYRFTTNQVQTGYAVSTMKQAFGLD